MLPAGSLCKVGMQARGVADIRQRGALQSALPGLSFLLQLSLLQGRMSENSGSVLCCTAAALVNRKNTGQYSMYSMKRM